MARHTLTPEQQAEAQRIRQTLLAAADDEIRELSELLASRDDSNTFGGTEFTVRDLVHRIGAKALEAALDGRKKGATTAPPIPAPIAAKRPSTSGGNPGPS